MGVRIGTTEREAAVATLSQHLAAGRLTFDELFADGPRPGALPADLRASR
jgi:hypothetical protein